MKSRRSRPDEHKPRQAADFRRKPADARPPSRSEGRDASRPQSAPRERTAPTASLFGVLPVLEALRSDPKRIDKILVSETAKEHRLSEIIQLARQNGVMLNRVDRERFAQAAGADVNTQGVIAFAAAVAYADADELIDSANDSTLFLVLDGVEDPRNLGAVIRTAECAGVTGIFIPERRAVGLNETVAKSSAGAVEYAKVAKVPNISKLIDRLKQKNIWVVGTSGDAATIHTDWDWKRPTAVVLGAEGSGLHRLVAENCDVLVKIPMYGKINSLNVSVASGVILFEAQRQREK